MSDLEYVELAARRAAALAQSEGKDEVSLTLVLFAEELWRAIKEKRKNDNV